MAVMHLGKQEHEAKEDEHAEHAQDDHADAAPVRFPRLRRLQVFMPPAEIYRFGVVQLLLHRRRRGKAPMRLAFHGVENRLLQLFRDLGIAFPRRHGIARDT